MSGGDNDGGASGICGGGVENGGGDSGGHGRGSGRRGSQRRRASSWASRRHVTTSSLAKAALRRSSVADDELCGWWEAVMEVAYGEWQPLKAVVGAPYGA